MGDSSVTWRRHSARVQDTPAPRGLRSQQRREHGVVRRNDDPTARSFTHVVDVLLGRAACAFRRRAAVAASGAGIGRQTRHLAGTRGSHVGHWCGDRRGDCAGAPGCRQAGRVGQKWLDTSSDAT